MIIAIHLQGSTAARSPGSAPFLSAPSKPFEGHLGARTCHETYLEDLFFKEMINIMSRLEREMLSELLKNAIFNVYSCERIARMACSHESTAYGSAMGDVFASALRSPIFQELRRRVELSGEACEGSIMHTWRGAERSIALKHLKRHLKGYQNHIKTYYLK